MKTKNPTKQRAGRLGGLKSVETGHLAKLRTREHQIAAGKLGGRSAVLSGQILAAASAGGEAAAAKFPNHINEIRTPESCAAGARAALHLRWHVQRDIISDRCSLCEQEQLRIAAEMTRFYVVNSNFVPDTPPVNEVVELKSKAALRAERWRAKQKAENPEFGRSEVERKQAAQKELERKQQVEELLASGQFPANKVALRKKEGKRLFLTDAPKGKGLIVTGGYDTEKIAAVVEAHINKEGGPNAVAQRKDLGFGSDNAHDRSPAPPKMFNMLAPREVRVMLLFLQGFVTESEHGLVTCLHCKQQIAPSFSYEIIFNHVRNNHYTLFTGMVAKIWAAVGCPLKEDHKRFSEEHGSGLQDIYCAKCNKLLFEAPKIVPGRSRTEIARRHSQRSESKCL